MKKLVFLDIDGVLNSRPFLIASDRRILDTTSIEALDPRAVALLDALHKEHDPEWVLSSSWRYEVSPERMTTMLRHHGWTGEVTDSTPYGGLDGRGREIHAWLEENGQLGRHFVILDDNSDMDPYLGHLVQTDFDRGLQDVHLEGVRRKFRQLALRDRAHGH